MNRLLFELRLLYKGLLRRGQKRMVIVSDVKESQEVEPIFIIGCPRSGTSLLRRIIDSHSRIACPPESYFLIPVLGILNDKRALFGLESMGFSNDMVLIRLRNFINHFFSSYAKAKGKPRWADKTPLYVDHLNVMDVLYQKRARYIMLYRHGLDVAYSMNRALPGFLKKIPNYSKIQEHRETPRIAAAYWRDQITKMRIFQARHPRQCFEIRYEKLTQEPDRILPEMFDFLGEKFEKDVLHFNDFEHDEGIGDCKATRTEKFTPSVENYKKWRPEQLKAALEEVDPLLFELGYLV